MLRKLPRQGAEAFPSSSRARRRRTSSPLQGPPGTRPVRGLRTLRILRISVSARIRGRKVQARTTSVVCEGMEHARIHSAVQGVRRLMQHSCGSARCQRSCVGARPPHHLRPRSSKVRLRRGSTWSLFLQASAGKNPARSPPGAQDTAVRIRSRPLAQRMPGIIRRKRQSRLLALPARIPRCPSSTAPVAPHQRCCLRASIRRSMPVREDRCTPHHRHLALTPLGRPGPGAVGRLPSAQAAGLCRRLGA